MSHPDRASDRLAHFLARSRHVAITGLGGSIASFALTWTGLLTWACFTNAQQLGPVRFLAALGLVVVTIVGAAVCGSVWWLAAKEQRWLLVVLTETSASTRTRHDATTPATPNGPRLVDATHR